MNFLIEDQVIKYVELNVNEGMAKNITSEDSLATIADLLGIMYRPRLLFDISPDDMEPNNLHVVLRNAGGIPAYNIKCKFKDPIPYYENTNLSDLPILQYLPFLAQGQEIRFFYDTFFSIMDKGPASGYKETQVTLTYTDSIDKEGEQYKETFPVDFTRYKNILTIDRKNVDDIVKELNIIRRQLERIQNVGLLVRNSLDIARERGTIQKSRTKKQQ